MCGFVAVLDPSGVPPGLVARGLDALAHRGPDGRGTWRDPSGTVELGHVRLAFTDLEGGRQPVADAAARVVAAVNGEHYGDVDERRRLEARGVAFRTRCDAELLPNLWKEAGAEGLVRWRGELGAVLWDRDAARLVAVRDRFGAKPVFWSRVGARVLVASEARALFAMGVAAAWDVDSVRHALALQYTLPDRSLFLGVRVLPPGHVLSADGSGARVTRWWTPPAYEPSDATFDDARDELRATLDEAVRIRLRGEREVGSLLSGGIDSASVAALAARHASRPLRTFTVRFDHEGWDESEPAAELARSIGARHDVVEVDSHAVVDAFADAVVSGEGLAINGHVGAKWLLFKAIRNAGVAAVLSGEGADELLLGYPHFRVDVDGDPVGRLAALRQTNVTSHGVQLPAGEVPALADFERAFGFVPTFLRAKAALGLRVRPMLRDGVHDEGAIARFAEALAGSVDRAAPPVLRSARLWTLSALATSILRTLGDAQEMAHGVEGRLPFLDPALESLAARLPVGFRIHEGREKHVLRESMRGVVVESVRGREKRPFMAPPLTAAGRPHVRDWLRETLSSSAARDQPFFEPARVVAALDRLETPTPAEAAAAEPVFALCASIVALQRRVVGPGGGAS